MCYPRGSRTPLFLSLCRFPTSGPKRLNRHISAGEADIPAIYFLRDRDGLGCTLKWTTPTESDATNPGEDREPVVQFRPVAELLVGEGVIAVAAPVTRKARLLACLQSAKERLVGLVEPRQDVLRDMRDMRVDAGVLGKRSADGLAFGFLLIGREGDGCTTVGGDPLLKRGVIQPAT